MSKRQQVKEVPVIRSFPVTDFAVRAEASGAKVVDAYAAVFNVAARVTDRYWIESDPWDDHYGTYDEIIDPKAFRKTLADKGTNFRVLFNHGMTIYGYPAPDYSMPIGTPVEIKADAKGLWTSTRYASTDLASEVLQLIEDEAIVAMSFQGKMIESKLTAGTREGDVDEIVRLEIALREYGPCVFPAHPGAEIVGVRAQALLAGASHLNAEEKKHLLHLLQSDTPAEAGRTATSEPEPSDSTDTPQRAAEEAPEASGPSLSLLELEHAQRKRRAV